MPRWVGAFVLVLVCAGSAFGWHPDAWITMKAKIALLTDPVVRVRDVNVDTIDGQVSLHGKVPSKRSRERAKEVVRSIEGVEEVQNLLQIVPSGEEGRTERDDSRIREDVHEALASNPALRNTGIRIASVNKGVALLAGTARSSAEHLEAVYTVREVPGVRAVPSEVRISEPELERIALGDYELQVQGRALADVSQDLWITARVRLGLFADSRVPALDVRVDVTERVVTLFGIVSSREVAAVAERIARRTDGVHAVENLLEVVPERTREVVEAKDEQAREAVIQRLAEHPGLRGNVIDVHVHNGIVRLSGTVPTEHHRIVAAATARRVSAVRAVEEDLRVRSIVRPLRSNE